MAAVTINLSGTGTAYGTLSAPEYVDLERDNRSFAAVAAWSPRSRTLGGEGSPPERVPAAESGGVGPPGTSPGAGRPAASRPDRRC